MELMRPSLAVEQQVKVASMALQVKSHEPPTPLSICVPPTLVELTWP